MPTRTNPKVDALFAPFARPGSPGSALGVIRDGALIYKQGYGLANLEYDVPITPSTIFHVASMSKQFATMAVALLAEAGHLSLDDDIRTYLPEVPDLGQTITIHHLIHHTSGLRSDVELLVLAGWRLEDVITNTDVMALIKGQRNLNFPPGSRFSYCGTGYLLLALLVEQVSGQSLDEFCRERIFCPLGMANTHFHDDYLKVVKNRAYAYYATGENEYKNAILTCALTGGTGLYTTVEDLARWDENFYTGQVGGPAVIEQMHQRGVLNDGEEIDYAFGLVCERYKGREVVTHGGDGAGIHGYMMRFPQEHFSVVVLGNHSTLNARRLAQQVADLYLPPLTADAAPGEAVPEPIDLSEAQLGEKAGRYYDTESSSFVDVEFKAGHLQIWGYDLLPVSATHFIFAAAPEANAEFTPATAGRPARVCVDTGASRMRYELAEPAAPTPAELQAYSGRYYSPEMDVYWRIVLEGDRLVVHRRRQGTSPLVPMIADVFTDGWMSTIIHGTNKPMALAFERDAHGRVSGFRISDAAARVRNVRFVRQDA